MRRKPSGLQVSEACFCTKHRRLLARNIERCNIARSGCTVTALGCTLFSLILRLKPCQSSPFSEMPISNFTNGATKPSPLANTVHRLVKRTMSGRLIVPTRERGVASNSSITMQFLLTSTGLGTGKPWSNNTCTSQRWTQKDHEPPLLLKTGVLSFI